MVRVVRLTAVKPGSGMNIRIGPCGRLTGLSLVWEGVSLTHLEDHSRQRDPLEQEKNKGHLDGEH